MLSVLFFTYKSIGFLTLSAFHLSAGWLLLSTARRERATTYYAAGFLFLALFQFCFAVGAAVYHPLTAYVRIFSMAAALTALACFAQVLLRFPPRPKVPDGRALLVFQAAAIIVVATICIIKAARASVVLDFSTHQWALDWGWVNDLIAGSLVSFIGICFLASVPGLRAVWQEERAAYLKFSIVLWGATFLPGVTYLLSENVIIERGVHFLVYLLCATVTAFYGLIFYLDRSAETSSLSVKVIGINALIIISLLHALALFSLRNGEDAYDVLQRTRLQAGVATRFAADANFPFVHKRDLRSGEGGWLPGKNPASLGGPARMWEGSAPGERTYASIGPDQFTLYSQADPAAGVVWTVLVDYRDYRRFVHSSAIPFVLFLVLCFALTAFLFPAVYSESLLRPLRSLLEGVQAMKRGRRDVAVRIHYEDEIGTVARTFNQMIVAVREGEEKARRATRMELELLKRTILPHFLLNALSDIDTWLERDPGKASQLMHALAEELQAILAVSGQKLIPLSEEVHLCRVHISVMNLRYKKRFRLVTENIDGTERIPPLVLHTIIENGITHGFAERQSGTFVLGKRRLPGGFLRYSLSNDGSSETQGRKGSTGIGLKYVAARLSEAYGESFKVDSRPTGQGWEATLDLPDSE